MSAGGQGQGGVTNVSSATATASVQQHLPSVGDFSLQPELRPGGDFCTGSNTSNLQSQDGVTVVTGGPEVSDGNLTGASIILLSQVAGMNCVPNVTSGHDAFTAGGLEIGMQGNVRSDTSGLPNFMSSNALIRAPGTCMGHHPTVRRIESTEYGEQKTKKRRSEIFLHSGEELQQIPQEHAIRLASGHEFEPVVRAEELPVWTYAGYATLWAGLLTAKINGRLVPICNLQCLRPICCPQTLAADWPLLLHAKRIFIKEALSRPAFVVTAKLLLLRASRQHLLFDELKKSRKQAAIILLPSQVLLISGARCGDDLLGMLYPRALFQCLVTSRPPHTWA